MIQLEWHLTIISGHGRVLPFRRFDGLERDPDEGFDR